VDIESASGRAAGCRCDSVCAAERVAPASGGICDAAALRPVPHHHAGDRGRGASPQTGAPAQPLRATPPNGLK